MLSHYCLWHLNNKGRMDHKVSKDFFMREVCVLSKQASPLKALGKFFTRGLKSLPKETQKGLRSTAESGRGGPESFITWLPEALIKKVVGAKKYQNFKWNKLQAPSHSVNIAAGNVVHDAFKRIPGLKSLMLEKHKIPVKGGKYLKEVKIPSMTAPLSKATAIATPFALGMGGEKALESLREFKKRRQEFKAGKP